MRTRPLGSLRVTSFPRPRRAIARRSVPCPDRSRERYARPPRPRRGRSERGNGRAGSMACSPALAFPAGDVDSRRPGGSPPGSAPGVRIGHPQSEGSSLRMLDSALSVGRGGSPPQPQPQPPRPAYLSPRRSAANAYGKRLCGILTLRLRAHSLLTAKRASSVNRGNAMVIAAHPMSPGHPLRPR